MEYTLVRTNKKTISVTVKDGQVVVRAPMRLSEEKIAAFLSKHRRWISRRIAEQRAAVKPEFTDGSVVFLFGNNFTVATGRAGIKDGTLFLPQENREEALIFLLKRLTRERMTHLTDEIAKKHGFRFSGITITSARTRWGSCNARGRISYTFRTAFLPDALAVYLAVHELCHTRHLDHSAAFWRDVEKLLPDYSLRRKALKQYLWAMKCL